MDAILLLSWCGSSPFSVASSVRICSRRDQLRCKEIWVVGADRWRHPEEDLPADFAERREPAHPAT